MKLSVPSHLPDGSINPEYRKAWVAAHPDKMKEYSHRYMRKHLEERRRRARDWGRNNIPRRFASALGLPTLEGVPTEGWPPGEGPEALTRPIARRLGLYRCNYGMHYVRPILWTPVGRRAKHPEIPFLVCPVCMNGCLPVRVRFRASKLASSWARIRARRKAEAAALASAQNAHAHSTS